MRYPDRSKRKEALGVNEYGRILQALARLFKAKFRFEYQFSSFK
jgi:hypothetical protein